MRRRSHSTIHTQLTYEGAQQERERERWCRCGMGGGVVPIIICLRNICSALSLCVLGPDNIHIHTTPCTQQRGRIELSRHNSHTQNIYMYVTYENMRHDMPLRMLVCDRRAYADTCEMYL